MRVDAAFHMAANHHNPMEGPVTVAWWEGDRLTLYDSTMGVRASQLTVAHLLGLPLAHVRVLAGFVGGSFGMKAMVWPHVTLTAMAARTVGRPVRLMLTRPQLFTTSGQREEQEQRIALGATRAGRLTAIRHEKLSVTSPFDDWAEPATGRQLAALRVRALPRRAPADPRQHDDADVHARPGRGARRLHARDARWTSSRTRSGSTPSSCGCATTRRSTIAATRGPATGCPSACGSGRARFGWAERDPAAALARATATG